MRGSVARQRHNDKQARHVGVFGDGNLNFLQPFVVWYSLNG